ncbi:MAG: hypothetical protein ACI8XB_001289 [Patiriisocius sp.]|jgi:hypothetical protein
MNLKNEILYEHSKRNMLRSGKLIGSDKSKFKILIKMMLGNVIREQQLAAAVFFHCIEANPSWLAKHIPSLVKKIQMDETHNALRRNFFRVLQYRSISQKHQGIIYNLGMDRMLDIKETVAVKAFAMTALFNICKEEPELKNELALVIKDVMRCGKVAVTGRGSKILRVMDKGLK